MWLGAGVIGGVGLGLGYISPVSTLIKWFPDRRGMATGMAIMGFGGGAMIGSPLATLLMGHFKTPTDPGVWQTFIALAAIYAVFMLIGAFALPSAAGRLEARRLDAAGQRPTRMITANQRAPRGRTQDAAVLAAVAHALPQRVGRHRHHRRGLADAAGDLRRRARSAGPSSAISDIKKDAALAAQAAAVGAGFVGLISLFNIFGRIAWASSSDRLGRKTTYFIFFVLGAGLYVLASFAADWKILALFVGCFCIIASMYGGGFATIPAYLADMFGTQFVGAIHGRLLTAWSTAGIVGPVIVNYLHDTRQAAGIAPDQIYGPIFYMLAGLLVAGFVANLLVRPVNAKWHMSEADVAAEQRQAARDVRGRRRQARSASARAASTLKAVLFWLLVGIPLAWGIWNTVEKALVLFTD